MQTKNLPVSNTKMLTLLATVICGDEVEQQIVRDQLIDLASSPIIARRLVRIFDADPGLAEDLADVNLAARLTLAPTGVEWVYDDDACRQGSLLPQPSMH